MPKSPEVAYNLEGHDILVHKSHSCGELVLETHRLRGIGRRNELGKKWVTLQTTKLGRPDALLEDDCDPKVLKSLRRGQVVKQVLTTSPQPAASFGRTSEHVIAAVYVNDQLLYASAGLELLGR